MSKQKNTKAVLIVICVILILELLSLYTNTNANTYTQTVKVGIENFPVDYQEKLNALKEIYPNWKFSAYYTGITWNDFINAETSTHLRNTVIKTSDSLWKDSCEKIASGYSCASKPIIQYFADPRNFINEAGIFQFLEMTYNEELHTEDSVKSIIANTFMNKEVPVTIKIGEEEKDVTMHYSKIIMEAAKESKMSPYSIAIKIIQEVGRKGSSSVSGHYVARNGTVYDGFYNFFNYGAYDSGDAIANGLEYAKNNGWTNPYIAIIEGSKLMANSYTNAGQNTAYFYKWDVVGSSTSELFWHQYMTNIQDPSSQAKSLYNTYVSNNLINESLSFIIPVFEDMPNANNLPTTIDTTLESSYYLTGSDVRLRENPSTSSSILTSLGKDTVVTLLNWDAGTANGYEWAKIRLSNGTEGFIARQYLKPCNKEKEPENTVTPTPEPTTTPAATPTPTPADQPIENEEINSDTEGLKSSNEKIVKVSGNYLITIPNTKNTEITENLNLETYTILNFEGKEIPKEECVGTGAKLKIDDKEYTIIVIGDINGDNSINSGDLLLLKKYLLGTSGITDKAYISSMDINYDNTINSGDLLLLKKHLLGTTLISL